MKSYVELRTRAAGPRCALPRGTALKHGVTAGHERGPALHQWNRLVPGASDAPSELGQDVGGVQHVVLLAAGRLHRVAGVLEVDDAVALLDLPQAYAHTAQTEMRGRGSGLCMRGERAGLRLVRTSAAAGRAVNAQQARRRQAWPAAFISNSATSPPWAPCAARRRPSCRVPPAPQCRCGGGQAAVPGWIAGWGWCRAAAGEAGKRRCSSWSKSQAIGWMGTPQNTPDSGHTAGIMGVGGHAHR